MFECYNGRGTERPISGVLGYLVAVDTSRFERLGVMSAAVDVTVLVEVDEIDEQLDTDDTDETRWMPTHFTARSTCEHRQLALPHRLTTLLCIHNRIMRYTLQVYKASRHIVAMRLIPIGVSDPNPNLALTLNSNTNTNTTNRNPEVPNPNPLS